MRKSFYSYLMAVKGPSHTDEAQILPLMRVMIFSFQSTVMIMMKSLLIWN